MHTGIGDEELTAYDIIRDDISVRRREIEGRMVKLLSRRIVGLLRDLGRAGDDLELPVYAVGGFVRDLLLGSETFDIDVTVEGDGILFAEEFARRHGCRTKSHQAFGTAVLVFPDGFKIDVASTRLEYYETPGALPVVERSSLKMDLYRRDFTINTLAICLNSGAFGTLVDYFGAQRDLQNRSIRVLHNLSFVEDPTRVFRAVRFEQRLGFHLAPHTEHLIRNAVRMEFLQKLGGRRLLNELVLILREKDPTRSVDRMAILGLLRYIHPEIHLTDEIRRVLDDTREMLSWYDLLYTGRPAEKWVVYFLSLCSHLPDSALLETCSRLAVSEQYRHTLHDARRAGYGALERLEEATRKQRQLLRSTIYGLLKDLPVEVVLHLMARAHNESVRKCISLYVTTLQDAHCLITGDDLLAMGIPPGPVYRTIFDLLLAEQLDGELTSREDELQRARRIADSAPR
jgi:tRNA nucleotidyltransferase (CCA-adding enzyme)